MIFINYLDQQNKQETIFLMQFISKQTNNSLPRDRGLKLANFTDLALARHFFPREKGAIVVPTLMKANRNGKMT